MPELPEVERARRFIEKNGASKKILEVKTYADPIVFKGVTHTHFAKTLRNRKIEKVHRHGKQLWIELDQAPHPLFHLAMTGKFESYSDIQERPKYLKAEFLFSDGTRLGFTNARRFGRIQLKDDPRTEPPISKLGPDPVLNFPKIENFRTDLAKRKGNIKGLLLNQSFIAGIGNWIADEILYQSKISPNRTIDQLNSKETGTLHRKIKEIIHFAVSKNANAHQFPNTWMFHQRWRDGRGRSEKREFPHEIRFDKIAGRSTAWVPKIQK